MPYHIGASADSDSEPHAVIKDDDGEVMGCHASEAEARRQMAVLYAEDDDKSISHMTVKAVATLTDQGVFEAVISTESVDREKDIVSADAMVAALSKWNRPIPLAWNHSTSAEDIFGHIDPGSVKAVDQEVVAAGQVDLESKTGQEAWRSFKSRAIGFSFGYLILESQNRKGGGRHITSLDVFEVTATPTPMNNDTRVLSTKSVETLQDELQQVRDELVQARGRIADLEKKAGQTNVDPLREASRQAVADIRLDGIPERKSPLEPERPDTPSEGDLRGQYRELMLTLLRE